MNKLMNTSLKHRFLSADPRWLGLWLFFAICPPAIPFVVHRRDTPLVHGSRIFQSVRTRLQRVVDRVGFLERFLFRQPMWHLSTKLLNLLNFLKGVHDGGVGTSDVMINERVLLCLSLSTNCWKLLRLALEGRPSWNRSERPTFPNHKRENQHVCTVGSQMEFLASGLQILRYTWLQNAPLRTYTGEHGKQELKFQPPFEE